MKKKERTCPAVAVYEGEREEKKKQRACGRMKKKYMLDQVWR
jgi:hypothetical protein